jgi:hypothetical protein
MSEDKHQVVFPPISRLGPNEKKVLWIRVQADTPGPASCQVSVAHDDPETGKIVKTATTRVTRAASARR